MHSWDQILIHPRYTPRILNAQLCKLCLMKSIVDIKSNAVGSDKISPTLIKLILPHIARYITHIYNTILNSSEFPTLWKIAKVIPIPKVENLIGPCDFRPKSILSYLSKGFERIVASKLQSHIASNQLQTTWQSGFRSSRSTTTPLLDVVETLRHSLDNRDLGILTLLDFSKAFDTVDHDILLHKLKRTSKCNLVQSNFYLLTLPYLPQHIHNVQCDIYEKACLPRYLA